MPSRLSYSLSDASSPLLPDLRRPCATPRPIVDIDRPRGVGAGNWVLPTDEAIVLVLFVEERELRVLAGGEVVDSSFVGFWMI